MWKNDKHRHMSEVHSKAGRVKCPDCGKDFSRRENMLVHQKQSHSDNAQSFKCDECPAEFTRKFYLKKHKQKGKHYIEILCKYCDQIITFKSHASAKKDISLEVGRLYTLVKMPKNAYFWEGYHLRRRNRHLLKHN